MTGTTPPQGIVILGVPRSGTTLVRRLLDAHPGISCPGETYVLGGCARFLRGDRGAEGMDLSVVSGLSFAGFTEQQVLEALREFAFGFFRGHARRAGKARWAEKSATDAFYAEEIERFCAGHVKFICVQRHALDVVCSLQEFCDRTQGYLTEIHEYVRRYPRPAEAFAHIWSDLTQRLRGLCARHPKDAITVRYEDLVAGPEQELRRLLEFLGEPWEDTVLERAMHSEPSGFGDWKTYTRSALDRQGVGRWKELTPGTIGSLAGIVNPLLNACGYEEVAAGEDLDDDEARRRYELGLMVQSMKRKRPS